MPIVELSTEIPFNAVMSIMPADDFDLANEMRGRLDSNH